MVRTHYNNDLGLENIGQEVQLLGWVSKRRNLGAILFIDLRDRSGIVQIVVNEGVEVPASQIQSLKLVKSKLSLKRLFY